MAGTGKIWKEFFQIVDKHTGNVVGRQPTRKRATTRVDKLDNEYGAYRYRAKRAWEDEDGNVVFSDPTPKADGEESFLDAMGVRKDKDAE